MRIQFTFELDSFLDLDLEFYSDSEDEMFPDRFNILADYSLTLIHMPTNLTIYPLKYATGNHIYQVMLTILSKNELDLQSINM